MKSTNLSIVTMIFAMIVLLLNRFPVDAQLSTDTYQPTSMPTGFPTWQPATNLPFMQPLLPQDPQTPNVTGMKDPNITPQPNWRRDPVQDQYPSTYPAQDYNINQCQGKSHECNQRSECFHNQICAPCNGGYSCDNRGCTNVDCYPYTNRCGEYSYSNRGCAYNSRFCQRNSGGCQYQVERCGQLASCSNSGPSAPSTPYQPPN